MLRPPGLLYIYLLRLAGDAFVRELDVSKVTLRLREKQDRKGDSEHDRDHTLAQLQGSTLEILQRCLVTRCHSPHCLLLLR